MDSDQTMPRFLYRYRAYQDDHDSLRKILVKNRWYFGSRTKFDDEDDSVLPGVLVDDRDHLEKLVRAVGGTLTTGQIDQFLADPHAERNVTTEVQGYIDRLGILCLSELDDDPELWRLYADSERGVCLSLDMTKIVDTDYYRLRGPFEVKYHDGVKERWDPRTDPAGQLAQTEDHLLRKAERWKYQKEWRFLLHRDRECTVGEHPMPADALHAVILDRRLTEAECKEVAQWIRLGPWNPSPTIYCREVAQSHYTL